MAGRSEQVFPDGCRCELTPVLCLIPEADELRRKDSELGLGAAPVQCLRQGWSQLWEPKVLAACIWVAVYCMQMLFESKGGS